MGVLRVSIRAKIFGHAHLLPATPTVVLGGAHHVPAVKLLKTKRAIHQQTLCSFYHERELECQSARMFRSSNRRGWCLANSSITSGMSMPMSLCKWRSASDVRRSLPIVDLSAVLILFRPLNDRSAEQEVTGSVQSMCNSSVMFGNIELARGSVNERVVGSDRSPWSCFS